MPRRKAVWKPSDIGKWGAKAAAAEPAAPALHPETLVQVTVGRKTWSMQVRWLDDRLSAAEKKKLQASHAAGRPLQLPKRGERPALKLAPMPKVESAQ